MSHTLMFHTPSCLVQIMADDTSAIGFPFFTNRPIKSTATKRRLDFIPWLMHDHARHRSTYIYTMKGAFKKGANRFCTMLYAIVKSLKLSGGVAAGARTLVFIGDNYCENKNNIDLAFACDLVKHGW